MAMHGHSEACCNTPFVQADGYKEKGEFIEIDGLKTYATGPSSAKSAIFIIYDVFGYSPQILQGADLLAHTDDEHHQYRVYMPDLLKGQYASPSWFPPDTEEKQKALGDYFKGPGAPQDAVAAVPKLAKEIESKFPGIESWGVLGYCWGGKIVSLSTQSGTIFKAGAEVHPGMVDGNDAKGIKIPLAMLASRDEPENDVKEFENNLTGEKHVETFSTQVHGWMAARADLKDETVKKEYERGYKVLLDFFHKYL